MNFSLRCHLCKASFPATALWVCDQCLGPLEVTYDYTAIARLVSRELIESRPESLWRYREFLPIEREPLTGLHSGFTPLVRAERLAKRLGVRELYVKDDSVNHPTCSYKDRVVSVAATRAVELGFSVFACASTGNLANSVASHAARLGLSCSVFIPDDLEAGKVTGAAVYRPRIIAVRGNYDDVNRLCTQVADRYNWGFANINLRAYYAEGAKTYGFEIAEQLGWRFPRHVVSPVAGGTLLPRISKASPSCAKWAWSRATCRRSMPRRRRAVRRWCARSPRGSSTPSPSSRTRSPSRSPSAIPPTASRCCAPFDRRGARARWSPTTRSSRGFSSSPRPKASSPNRREG
jgi:threonine synthase